MSVEKKQVETIKIEVEFAKGMIDYIQSRKWFKQYRDLNDFIEEAVRERMHEKMRVYGP